MEIAEVVAQKIVPFYIDIELYTYLFESKYNAG